MPDAIVGTIGRPDIYLSSYIAFCDSTKNADMLDSAFGKINTTVMHNIGRQMALYSWFKGDNPSIYPYVATQSMDTLTNIYNDIYSAAEVESSISLITLMKSSPYANSIRDTFISNSTKSCQVLAIMAGLPNPEAHTTALALTADSTFMNKNRDFWDLAFSYTGFVTSFISSNTNWMRMINYTTIMQAFEASDVAYTVCKNNLSLFTVITGGNGVPVGINASTVYCLDFIAINSGNYSPNACSWGTTLTGATFTANGYGEGSFTKAGVSRKFFKPSTFTKSGGGGVQLTFRAIS